MERMFKEEVEKIEKRIDTNMKISMYTESVRASVRSMNRSSWRSRPNLARGLFNVDGTNTRMKTTSNTSSDRAFREGIWKSSSSSFGSVFEGGASAATSTPMTSAKAGQNCGGARAKVDTGVKNSYVSVPSLKAKWKKS